MNTMREALIDMERTKFITRAARNNNFDINGIMRLAEHRISYSAKRAIEMYYSVWVKKPAWYLFLKCAEANSLNNEEISACRRLMEERGMVEEGA